MKIGLPTTKSGAERKLGGISGRCFLARNEGWQIHPFYTF